MSLSGNSLTTASLQPALRQRIKYLTAWASHLGATVRVTSARRSRAQQVNLYRNFLLGRSKYPVAPPGRSKHEQGLAVDIVTTPYAALYTLGPWWRTVGGTWNSSDPIHFEL